MSQNMENVEEVELRQNFQQTGLVRVEVPPNILGTYVYPQIWRYPRQFSISGTPKFIDYEHIKKTLDKNETFWKTIYVLGHYDMLIR